MILPLVLAPLAEDDLRVATYWYDRQQPGLGDAFLRSVDATLARIQRLPMAFPADDFDIHSALLHRFPFSVRFRVRNDRSEVIAIWHGRHNPDGWRTRTR